MIDKETLYKYIIKDQSYDIEISETIHKLLDRKERERKLNTVSTKFLKACISNLDANSIKLLITAYYYPKELKKNEYYDAIKLLTLFFVSNYGYPYDDARLNIMNKFIDEGSSYVDKTYRTLFMYDLHISTLTNDDLAFYMNLIDYKSLIEFLELNDISFRSIGDKELFNKESFHYQLTYIRSMMNNYNKRLIK